IVVRDPGGVQMLRAHGIESETELAFGGLLELVRPLAELIPRLPEPQARALEGALLMGPAAGADRFSVSAATLGILGRAARPAVARPAVHPGDPLRRSAALAGGGGDAARGAVRGSRHGRAGGHRAPRGGAARAAGVRASRAERRQPGAGRR